MPNESITLNVFYCLEDKSLLLSKDAKPFLNQPQLLSADSPPTTHPHFLLPNTPLNTCHAPLSLCCCLCCLWSVVLFAHIPTLFPSLAVVTVAEAAPCLLMLCLVVRPRP